MSRHYSGSYDRDGWDDPWDDRDLPHRRHNPRWDGTTDARAARNGHKGRRHGRHHHKGGWGSYPGR